jgi:hypothetical protein
VFFRTSIFSLFDYTCLLKRWAICLLYGIDGVYNYDIEATLGGFLNFCLSLGFIYNAYHSITQKKKRFRKRKVRVIT